MALNLPAAQNDPATDVDWSYARPIDAYLEKVPPSQLFQSPLLAQNMTVTIPCYKGRAGFNNGKKPNHFETVIVPMTTFEVAGKFSNKLDAYIAALPGVWAGATTVAD